MQSFWHKKYPTGIPTEIELTKFSSLADMLEKSVANFSDKVSFSSMGQQLTYKELDTLSLKFASYLQNDLGLKRGSRVALMLPNILQYPICLFGILRAGMVVVNVNPLYTARELEHQLQDSNAETIVLFSNSANVLEAVLENTNIKNVVVTDIGDFLGFPKSMLANFVIKHIKKMVPKWNIPTAHYLKKVLSKSDPSKFKREQIDHDDIAFLQYTGGTTGSAKGAILTHGNMVANVLQVGAWVEQLFTPGEEIIITAIPLYHIFSLTANCLLFTSLGCQNVLIINPRDKKAFISELKKQKFSVISGVNTLFKNLMTDPEFKTVDFSKLSLAIAGGMSLERTVSEQWREITGMPIIEGYGLTEASPIVCINPLNLGAFNGFVGLPIPSTIIEIKDKLGNPLPCGEIGEVCVKGPQVMSGYWNLEHETSQVFTRDGFLKTGDLGFMTEEGFVKLVDRRKDLIIVSGFNVYPTEIETIVSEHPKVFELAAVGIESERTGEAVKLFVVKKDHSLTVEELKEFCKENLTPYKVPKFFEFRETLPKSNVGKILRKELREESNDLVQ